MSPAITPIFEETQWFWRRWWWLIGPLSLLPLALETLAFSHPLSSKLLLTVGPIGVLMLAGMALLRLTVRIDAVGIHYQYIPLLNRWRHWPWSEFRRVFPRTYSPLGDFGGWGIKGFPGDLVYNVWGPDGLQLVFRSGNRLLLGTQRPDELRAALALLAADASRPIKV